MGFLNYPAAFSPSAAQATFWCEVQNNLPSQNSTVTHGQIQKGQIHHPILQLAVFLRVQQDSFGWFIQAAFADSAMESG